MSTITRKIGMNRGKPRLWLEGAFLTTNGFAHGARWSVERANGGLVIYLDAEGGARRIAGTGDRPIIDINSAALLEGIGPIVTVVGSFGVLTVRNQEGE